MGWAQIEMRGTIETATRGIAWCAGVDKKAGELTVALADKDGTYVYFGVCTSEKK